MLDILDYTKQELISDADFWQFAGEHLEKPTEFRGVSFVSSIKFIEEQLLPRYDKVTLILGLSDNGKESIGKRMRQLNDRTEFVNYGYEHPDSEFTKRILDGSLRLLFTKQELIHNPLCKRIYHAGNWQGKIQTVIGDKRKSKTAEQLKELIKTGNVQK